MSNIVNLNSIIGIATHKSIASEIEHWVNGKKTNFKRAKKETLDWVDMIWKKREEKIVEIANGFEIEKNYKNKIKHYIIKNLKNFFKSIWPQFRNHEYISHEKLESFELENYKIWVKVDFFTCDESGNYFLSDWKSKKQPSIEISTSQYYVYALWCKNFKNTTLENIKIRVGYTRTGDISTISPTSKDIRETVKKIRTECRQWRKSDTIEEYSPLSDESKCKKCEYLRKCRKGLKLFKNDIFRSKRYDSDK